MAQTVNYQRRSTDKSAMYRFVKGVLGGVLAILAAFGWTIAIVFMLVSKGVLSGVGLIKGAPLWSIVTLIFTVGFFLGFRAAYGPPKPKPVSKYANSPGSNYPQRHP
jgi:hypothetical protein